MSTKEAISELLSGDWYSINFENKAQEIISTPAKTIPLLVDLTRDSDTKIAWRAAYLLDKIHDSEPKIVQPYLKNIIQIAENTGNPSIRRHYLRILTHYDLSNKVSGVFIDLCFRWLHEEKVKTAVKAHAMQLLYNLTKKYPELIPELKASLKKLPANSSAGVQNRANKLLLKL